jgi:group I intron endonuclease
MGKYYIYLLLDSSKKGDYKYGDYSLEYEPFYVGKGSGNRIKHTLYDKSPFKYNKIKKLKNKNIDIKTIKLFDNLSEEECFYREIELISLIGRRDLNKGSLVNLTDGGAGRINSNVSDKTRIKISNKNIGIGRPHTQKTKELMSMIQSSEGNGFYGKNHTEEVKENQSKLISGNSHPMYGKTHSSESITKMKIKRNTEEVNKKIKEKAQENNKEVLMYSLDMVLLDEFESVKLASEKTEINESIISKSCRGDILNPTRYFFKYKNYLDIIKNNKFLISIGDTFIYNKIEYQLVKRNRTSVIALDIENEIEVTIRYKDCKGLTFKDSNDSEFIELYLFLKTKGDFKIDRQSYTIYNDVIIIYYNKLTKYSDLLVNDKKLIYNRYNEDKKIINIYEDTWRFKKDIIKSRLLNLLGKSKKIFGRKCVIKKVEFKDCKEFLNNNHMQGHVRSRINIGLYYEDVLVSLMTFGGLRKNLGQVSKEGAWELLRFSNILNTTVIGGASKLFKHFIKTNNVEMMISYADRAWSDGNLYRKLGLSKSDNKIYPSYFYIIDGIRKNRFAYRKDLLVSAGFDKNMTEVSIQHSRGYYRIFDLGSFKFEYFRDKLE